MVIHYNHCTGRKERGTRGIGVFAFIIMDVLILSSDEGRKERGTRGIGVFTFIIMDALILSSDVCVVRPCMFELTTLMGLG